MFGLPFHPYGLLIGIALVVGWELAQRACKKYRINFAGIQKSFILILIGGGISARLWHGVTDWSIYSENPIALLYIWNGGLSIIGGIIVGMLTAVGITFGHTRSSSNLEKLSLLGLTDLMVHALPISQALGRLGNFVNQELYGLPTQLPWGIYVDPVHRLPEVATYSHFHPLFFYEMILTIGIAVLIWQKKWHIGSGLATAWYMVLYGSGRLLLDFLRIDTGDYVYLGLSLNQYVLGALIMMGSILIWKQHHQIKSAKTGK